MFVGVGPPPPPARQVGQPQPKPPSQHGDQGGEGGRWANGLPCHPPPAKQFSSRPVGFSLFCIKHHPPGTAPFPDHLPSVTLQPPSVTREPPSVPLQPPSVTREPPSVPLQPRPSGDGLGCRRGQQPDGYPPAVELRLTDAGSMLFFWLHGSAPVLWLRGSCSSDATLRICPPQRHASVMRR